MNCSEVNDLLDRLMDDELSDDQRQAMDAHALGCPECAASIRSTLQLKALFAQLPEEVDVPLQAQAKWRGAVRQASRQQGHRRMIRWVASAAAAVIVLVGISLSMNLRNAPKANDTALLALEENAAEEIAEASLATNGSNARPGDGIGQDVAIVEADGLAIIEDSENGMLAEPEAEAEAHDSTAAHGAPTCELSIQVESVDTACNRIQDLVQEYEGTMDLQRVGDSQANIYVEIESVNADDFLNAVVPMDSSGQQVEYPDLPEEGHMLVLLVIHR